MTDRNFMNAESKMDELLRQQNLNTNPGAAAFNRSNSIDSNSYANPTLNRKISGASQPSQPGSLPPQPMRQAPVGSGIPSNYPFQNMAASDGYLRPPAANTMQTTLPDPANLSALGYGPRPPLYGSRVNIANLGYPSGQITSSRLTSAPYGNLLGRYPSLNPRVHPVMAQTHVIDKNNPQKSRILSSPVKISAQQLNATSKIEFIPYDKKVVEYKNQLRVQRIPKVRKVIEYRDEVFTDVVPREVVKQDYYAVEYLKQYVPEYVPERIVNMVQRAVPYKRIQYVPVTRQVYHGAPLGNCSGMDNMQLCNGSNIPLVSVPMPGQSHGIANASSFQGVQSFYQNYPGYPGDFLSNAKSVGSLPQDLRWLGAPAGKWQNNAYPIYGNPYGYGYGGYSTMTTTSMCDQFKRRINNLYDNYQSYIPSFKY